MPLTITFDNGTTQRVKTMPNDRALRIKEMFGIIVTQEIGEEDIDYFIRALGKMISTKLEWYEKRAAANAVTEEADIFAP